MKKENLRIFTLSFAIVYIMTASLCVLYRQPLVFSPGYSFSQFLTLFILLGLFSLALTLVMDILEKIFKKFLSPLFTQPISIYAYFILLSAFGLFILTLFAGFIESGYSPFFYYGCVTNSCLYLTSGYTVTCIAAIYFAYRISPKGYKMILETGLKIMLTGISIMLILGWWTLTAYTSYTKCVRESYLNLSNVNPNEYQNAVERAILGCSTNGMEIAGAGVFVGLLVFIIGIVKSFLDKKSTENSRGNSNQIIINGDASGSNFVIGNENDANISQKEGETQ